jgi:selenocysteine-specific elongation factor
MTLLRRVVVGTAGHIDHGKTSLVEALTGIDCDRWAEEKQRGITIDLGFAHLEREMPEGSTIQIGFVDVPGHERFLRNALAGLGGIRIMLLVVAADEGVKPQTREHLAVCSLLGIPAGLVALTKADLVDDELAELARLEVEELLEETPFAGAPVVPVSSVTREGLPALEERLLDLAAEHARAPEEIDLDLPARLPVDRAFHLKGLGVVVTGTLAAGRIAVGDSLEVLAGPPGASPPRCRVRSIQVHGEGREEAIAGERSALQLAGVDLDQVARGRQVVAPGRYTATRRLLVDFHVLPEAPEPFRGFTPVRAHLLSSQVLGKIRPLPRPEADEATGDAPAAIAPGGSGPAELRLREPVVAIRGDRLIFRRPSPETTLGGGAVLDPSPRTRRLRALAMGVKSLALSDGLDDGPALLHWAREAGPVGLSAQDAAQALGLPPERVTARLGELASAGSLLAVGARWIVPSTFQAIEERAARVLREFFERDRLAHGMAKAEAVARIFPGRTGELADVYLGWLAKRGVLSVEGDRIDLPGRTASLTDEESSLAKGVVERFRAAGLAPPSPGEVGRELSAKPQILEGVVRYLVDRGKLVKLPGGLVLAATAIEELRGAMEASGWERFSVADFKDRFGLSRKWAIPLLEHLDSIGATRRMGDERMVVRRVAE